MDLYNYWEPLHLLATPHALTQHPIPAFETWEYAPQFAIRSWAYIALHALPAALVSHVAAQPYAFYSVRILLAAVSAVGDAMLFRSVATRVNARVARYMLTFLTVSAGMHSASVALLPSSFAMYTTSVATAFAMQQREFGATCAFAFGALLGWPYALVVAIPFVVETLFFCDPRAKFFRRFSRLAFAGVLSGVLCLPIAFIDSLAYGTPTLAALNTVQYNVLSKARGIGPELYGTEPASYYIVNLLLNMNVVLPLALASLPLTFLTAAFAPARFTGDFPGLRTPGKPGKVHTTPAFGAARLLVLRLLPIYIWLGVLTAQAHKEERFMYVIYPLLCFNAAVALYFLRSWLEAGYLHLTRSPYRASRTLLFPACTLIPLLAAALLGFSRSASLVAHYRAPMVVTQALAKHTHAHTPATLCLGKEWHRFPSHFFVPPHVQVQFIPSAFRGILPLHFAVETPHFQNAQLDAASAFWPFSNATRSAVTSVNERNMEEEDRYVPLDMCDLLIDFDTSRLAAAPREPTYSATGAWEKLVCRPFLDADASRDAAQDASLRVRLVATAARTLWLPAWLFAQIPGWEEPLRYGQYCLLKRYDTAA
ncbi:dextrin dextranase [Malassezia vespertilionis]|uniref:dextrin dextranase n=1 Tax=Malassezia vespertilionis TaxID=2020962 RepID=UPI0024B19956|nr:dextrin dextranase [Malassezia vespertilionis]WFD06082.1 dextrin dextranase [Malassezia vespertilionis]